MWTWKTNKGTTARRRRRRFQRLLQYHTTLEIHLLSATEVLDVLGRMHGAMLRLRQEVHGLYGELRATRNMLGQLTETLGAHFPELAYDLGLTIRPGEDPAAAPPWGPDFIMQFHIIKSSVHLRIFEHHPQERSASLENLRGWLSRLSTRRSTVSARLVEELGCLKTYNLFHAENMFSFSQMVGLPF